jgi:hypothetical protein
MGLSFHNNIPEVLQQQIGCVHQAGPLALYDVGQYSLFDAGLPAYLRTGDLALAEFHPDYFNRLHQYTVTHRLKVVNYNFRTIPIFFGGRHSQDYKNQVVRGIEIVKFGGPVDSRRWALGSLFIKNADFSLAPSERNG